jgi:mono/diheme cytochrome c family protein
MKKIVFLTLTTGFILIACHRKTVPPAPVTQATTTAPAPTATDSTAMLADQGKLVYTARCGKCHALKNTANYTTDRWAKILQVMIPKAKLDENQAKQVTAYVMANAKQ